MWLNFPECVEKRFIQTSGQKKKKKRVYIILTLNFTFLFTSCTLLLSESSILQHSYGYKTSHFE